MQQGSEAVGHRDTLSPVEGDGEESVLSVKELRSEQ